MPQIIGLYNERFVCHKLLDCIMRDLYPTNYWIVMRDLYATNYWIV